jgi:hypothetical protein
MQLSHTVSALSVAFDDPNLVSSAGLVPVLALARRCGLHDAAGESLSVPSPNAAVKTAAVVAGMVAGADSIDDLDRLRHGGMGRLFQQLRAPSTLGTFLRSFTFGHVRQLDKVAATVLANLARHTPLLPDADRVCFADIDDTVTPTHGYAKQGAGYGYTHVKGLNALIGTLTTPTSAPVIAATRLRKGSTTPRGARRHSWPRRWPPPGGAALRDWSLPGWTLRSTPPTWWPRYAGPARSSPSPPAKRLR